MTEPPATVPRFRDALGRGFVVTAGLEAPRGADHAGFLAGARTLKGTVAALAVDGGTAALPCLIRERAGVDALFHMPGDGRSAGSVQSELLGAWALGVDNVLVFPPVPPGRGAAGPGEGARLSADGALALAAGLNEGRDWEGRATEGSTDFFIGVSSNPAAPDLSSELGALEARIAAGAHYSLTLPLYRRADGEAFLREAASRGIPVVVGLLPLVSRRVLRALDEALPAAVPPTVRERVEKSPEAMVREEGVRICRELIDELRGIAAGVHVMSVGDVTALREIVAGTAADGGEGPALDEALAVAAEGGRISCRAAHGVAAAQAVPVEEAGRAIERLRMKIVACRLGCFR